MTLIIQKPTGAKLVFAKDSVPFDNDAWTYIRAVETADGQILEQATRNAITNFVLGCKADGIWTAIKASCILAGARTLAGALVPLVGTAPTNVGGLFVSGDYNRKTGLMGDGSTKYLNSNRNTTADPQDSQHLSTYMSTAPTTGASLIGGGISASGVSGVLLAASRSRNTAAVNYPATATAGFIGISRGTSGSYVQRVNSGNTTVTQTSQTPPSVNITLYARIDTTDSQVKFNTDPRLAFYSIGESLNLALLDARVTDLINAFGAAIP